MNILARFYTRKLILTLKILVDLQFLKYESADYDQCEGFMSLIRDSESLLEPNEVDTDSGSTGFYRITMPELGKSGVEHLWCSYILPCISGTEKKIAHSVVNSMSHKVKEYLQLLSNQYCLEWVKLSKCSKSKPKKEMSIVNNDKLDVYYEYDVPRLRTILGMPLNTLDEGKEPPSVKDDGDAEEGYTVTEVEEESGACITRSIAEDAKLMETAISSTLKWRNRVPEFLLAVDDITLPSIKNLLVPIYEVFSATSIHLLYHRNVVLTCDVSLQDFRKRLSYIQDSYPLFRLLTGMLVEQRRMSIDPSAVVVINASLHDDSVVQIAHSDLSTLERAIMAYLFSLYTENCSEDKRKDRLIALRDYPQHAIFRSQKELAYRKFIQPIRKIGSYRVKVSHPLIFTIMADMCKLGIPNYSKPYRGFG